MCECRQAILNYVYADTGHYGHNLNMTLQPQIQNSAAFRNGFINQLHNNGFILNNFYVSTEHPQRNQTLFYQLAFGADAQIANTGLFENQFRFVFENPRFEDVIKFIIAQNVGNAPWHFNNQNNLLNFCNEIFNFNIPQFAQVMPIRLASYFYPEHFLPIFKINHLEMICNDFVPLLNCETQGEKLLKYNKIILGRLSQLQFDNYVKFRIAYLGYYTIRLCERLVDGITYPQILRTYITQWERDFIEEGYTILKDLNHPRAQVIYPRGMI